MKTNRNATITGYVVYFRRDGEKRALLRSTTREVGQLRRSLRRNKRKFLGYRPVTLSEVQ